MRFIKSLTAAAVSASLMAVPAVAAPSSAVGKLEAAARSAASIDADNDLFRNRKKRRGGGGVFVIVIIAIIIALGIYIIVDDDDNEAPASP